MTERLEQLRSALEHRYPLAHELGRGGMAVVYLAHDPRHDRPVAVKVLRPELAAALGAERFLREIRIAARLTHPHIVPVYDSGEAAGFLYYVMPYVEGESLQARLRRERQLPITEAVRLTREVAEALACAHGAGIIHRDIKPANILLAGSHAVVADFGLARAIAAAAGDEAITATGVGVGTPLYMSPEQADGTPVDARTDLYSLGTVLYEMLGGDPPFLGSSPQAILARKRVEPAPRLRPLRDSVSAELEQVVRTALARCPADRHATVAEFAEALAAALAVPGDRPSDPSVAARPTTRGDTPRPRTGAESVPLPFAVPARSDASTGLGIAASLPFVGREAEMCRLGDCLDRALGGEGGAMFLAGEAGSGKTALAAEFCRRAAAAHPELIVAVGNGNAYTGVGDPYLLFREILAQLTGDVEARCLAGSLAPEQASRLWNLLPTALAVLSEAGPELIDTLVSSGELLARVGQYAREVEEAAAWLPFLEERQTQHRHILPQTRTLCDQYLRVVRGIAAQAPLLLVLDDLQWADDSSVQLLFQLTRGLAGSRVLVLGLFRPSDIALGRGGQRHPLDPVLHELQRSAGEIQILLGAGEDRAFVDALVDAEPNVLGDEFREAVFGLTRGHALFTVETMRSLRDDGVLARNAASRWVLARPVDWSRVPPRVEAVIAERLARVPALLRRALAVASVEGERFTLEAVAAAAGMPAPELLVDMGAELQRRHHLVRADGIRRVEGRPVSVYRFRHVLFQRYLYDQLDPIERTLWHEQLGTALETLYGGAAGQIALALARHFREAGLPARTVPYLLEAGEQADDAAARAQAIVHYEAALAALLTLPPGLERNRQELELQLALGWARYNAPAPGAEEAFSRAQALADESGTAQQRFGVMVGLYMLAVWQSDQRRAKALMDQGLRLGLELNDPGIIVNAHTHGGLTALWRGEFRQALDHARAVLAEADPARHRDRRFFGGADPESLARTVTGGALWCLGHVDQGLEWIRDGVATARRLGVPSTYRMERLTALAWEAWFELQSGRPLVADVANREYARVSRESGMDSTYGGFVIAQDGGNTLGRGQLAEGIRRLKTGIDKVTTAGHRFAVRAWTAVLADGLRVAGRAEEGLRLLDQVPTVAPTVDDRWDEAEAIRIRGELLLAVEPARPDEAEAEFLRAITLAREQEARSWELRAAISLARLLRSQGRVAEGRQALREIYRWFTEGFDTRDLIDAKALLDELDDESSTRKSLPVGKEGSAGE